MRLLILFAFALSGTAALIYEVTWTRALSLIFGSTTYALSTMLSTFMAGLAIGGYVGGLLADRQKNLLLLFGLLELGIGIFGLVTIPLINVFSGLYIEIYHSLRLSPSLYFVVQFLLCAGVMLVPTTLMGATFPIVSRKVTAVMDEMGRGVGSSYSFNTFGAIIGSFSAGFILIPLVGLKAATLIAASVNLVVALTMIALSRARMKGAVIAAAIILISVPAVLTLVSQEDEWTANYYTAARFSGYYELLEQYEGSTILMEKEYPEGRVKLWRDSLGFLVVQAGGKVEGSNVLDVPRTHLLSYLPIASHPDPESLLLIGLGSGLTLSAAKEHIGDVTVVELNRGVVDGVGEYGTEGLLEGVRMEINDARNYLLLTNRKVDIIVSGPSYPTEASSGNLYTREFYEIVASRLNRGGVFSQSIPYYLLSNEDVTILLKTFSEVFDYGYLWKIEHPLNLMLVGSQEPFEFGSDEIMKRTAALNISNIPLNYVRSRGPDEIREIVRSRDDIPLNTDDRPLIEFHAAVNLLTGVSE
jgi:spermidine synthase